MSDAEGYARKSLKVKALTKSVVKSSGSDAGPATPIDSRPSKTLVTVMGIVVAMNWFSQGQSIIEHRDDTLRVLQHSSLALGYGLLWISLVLQHFGLRWLQKIAGILAIVCMGVAFVAVVATSR